MTNRKEREEGREEDLKVESVAFIEFDNGYATGKSGRHVLPKAP